MTSKFFNSRIFFIILSIIFAVFLYFNANNTSAQNTGTANSGGQVYSTVLKNIPVTLKYDSSKYFVTGYASSANVTLTSYNQIKLLQEESTDLRTFTLFSDLRSLSVGKHEVPIKAENLPTTINAQLSPSVMSVTIENKTSQSYSIQSVIDTKLLPAGFTIDETTVSPSKVTVTAGTNSIKNIAKIEAVLPSNADLTDDYNGQITLIAVNQSGQVVPALLSNSTAKLTVKVHKITVPSSSTSTSKS